MAANDDLKKPEAFTESTMITLNTKATRIRNKCATLCCIIVVKVMSSQLGPTASNQHRESAIRKSLSKYVTLVCYQELMYLFLVIQYKPLLIDLILLRGKAKFLLLWEG